jgi:peptidoglycan hydrolase CwlO-like protein
MEENGFFNNISTELVTFVGIILSNFATWFFTRKRATQEVKSIEITNLESTFAFYKTIIGDLESRVDRLQDKLDKMDGQIKHLEEENQTLKSELKKYKNDYK